MVNTVQLQFSYIKRTLIFRFDAGTSRGVLKTRDVYWIKARDPKNPEIMGWGEAAPLVKLSLDYREDFEAILEKTLREMCKETWENDQDSVLFKLKGLIAAEFPAIRFGLETAILDWINGGKKRILASEFFDVHKPIPINGLIWMGDRDFMLQQIDQKLSEGFNCIKMKIGAIDFEQEIELLGYIRSRFSKEQITLRIDANGAFSPLEALNKLKRLAEFDIQSIEQPIPAGNWVEMRKLCISTPLAIALDEELIGVREKEELLDQIQPQHIILKPTLVGGILETQEWIYLAEQRNIGWWMTSALESNIGLNAITQLASTFGSAIPQGLGTGKLYHNNLESPLEIKSGFIRYNSGQTWETPS
ncbi:o-succinylbenzoate synthase [Algoriphagus sp.]|uniref:o-succinylbenzoate synthase n=1 Tax=Algoriphagus sp. TaxID=1872435 RepID=UPI00391A6A16